MYRMGEEKLNSPFKKDINFQSNHKIKFDNTHNQKEKV